MLNTRLVLIEKNGAYITARQFAISVIQNKTLNKISEKYLSKLYDDICEKRKFNLIENNDFKKEILEKCLTYWEENYGDFEISDSKRFYKKVRSTFHSNMLYNLKQFYVQ